MVLRRLLPITASSKKHENFSTLHGEMPIQTQSGWQHLQTYFAWSMQLSSTREFLGLAKRLTETTSASFAGQFFPSVLAKQCSRNEFAIKTRCKLKAKIELSEEARQAVATLSSVRPRLILALSRKL